MNFINRWLVFVDSLSYQWLSFRPKGFIFYLLIYFALTWLVFCRSNHCIASATYVKTEVHKIVDCGRPTMHDNLLFRLIYNTKYGQILQHSSFTHMKAEPRYMCKCLQESQRSFWWSLPNFSFKFTCKTFQCGVEAFGPFYLGHSEICKFTSSNFCLSFRY